MATEFSHAVVAVALGEVYLTAQTLVTGQSSQFSDLLQSTSARFWTITILCATISDLDVIGYAFGVPYRSILGHRGLTHSLVFAAGLGIVAALAFPAQRFSGEWWSLAGYFFAVAASHGVLDAITNGGLGIAFFAPFDAGRYFLPWRPVEVSPIGISAFFSARALTVLKSELIWIWSPSLVVLLAALAIRRSWQP